MVSCKASRATVSGSPPARRARHAFPALFIVLVLLLSSVLLYLAMPPSEKTNVPGDPSDGFPQDPIGLNPRVWDWRGLADDEGYVDVIVTERVGTDAEPDSMLSLFTASEISFFSNVCDGFSARVPLDALDRMLSEGAPGLSIYPDLPVNATAAQPLEQIGAPEMWSRLDPTGRQVTGEDVTVAVIDTGIDYNHPDLGGGFGPGFKVIGGYDFHDRDSDPMDDNGHGTHVAGIIAASGASSGVAPDASLLAYKVLGADGSGKMSDVIAALDRAVDPDSDGDTSDHADVVSMSLGGSGQSDDPVCLAVQGAIDAGVVVVVAAGNSGPSLGTVASPGLAPDAITVGAIDSAGALASFSSRGAVPDLTIKPEISAPGVNIVSTVPYDGAAHSSSTGYMAMSGTSMATPQVSGGAALILQAHPDWTPSQVKSALVSGATPLNESVWLAGSGGLWLPGAADARLFFTPSIVSYGLAGASPQSISALNGGSTVTLGLSSYDFEALTADGDASSRSWTNVSSPAPTNFQAMSGQAASFQLAVPEPSAEDPEGYYDGCVLISGSGVSARLPFGFAVLSRMNVHVFDMNGTEVFDPYGGVWVYSTGTIDVATGVRGTQATPAPPASFLLPAGSYSVHSIGHQLLYQFDDPYLLSSEVSLGKLQTLDVNLAMTSARPFTLDLQTDDGKPIYVKDFRAYVRSEGLRDVSFDIVGSDYSVKADALFSLPTSKTLFVSDTNAFVGISIAGFSYSADMWDFMSRNWDHWFEYRTEISDEFYIEASTDLQYLLSWEYNGIDSSTPTVLDLVPGRFSVYDTKYDVPGELRDTWGDWGRHLSAGGDSSFYIRRDTDTSLNAFFSGMTRRTIVQGVFSEVYFPTSLFQGFYEREFYTPDYGSLVRADMASEVYLPNRNSLTPVEGVSTTQRIGSGPFYPAICSDNNETAMILTQPILRDQAGSKVGGKCLPSLTLRKSGQLVGLYQLSEYLARPDAERIVALPSAGSYSATIAYRPTTQICDQVTVELGFTVPSTDPNPPFMTGLAFPQRFEPGQTLNLELSAADDSGAITVNISWREDAADPWTAVQVDPLGVSSFGATITTGGATPGLDLRIRLTDSMGNYLDYTACNASVRQVPVSLEVMPSSSTIGYRNGETSVTLTGHLTTEAGGPISTASAVPLEMLLGGQKIGMLLDQQMDGASLVHDGSIGFEWHFNPARLFTGPGQDIQINISFDLGTYEPMVASFHLTSTEFFNPVPTITLVAPANGSLIASGNVIDLLIMDDGEVTAEAFLDGVSLGLLQSPWDIGTSSWSEGIHVLRIVATDDMMSETTSSFTFDVDTRAPAISILSPAPGSQVPEGWEIVLDVSDTHLGEVGYSLDGMGSISVGIPFIISMSGWNIGHHSFIATATDLVGRSSSASTYFEIIPGSLAISLLSPENGSVIRSGTPVEFSVLSKGDFSSRWIEGLNSHELAGDTSIDTLGWAEGAHDIVINSTDSLGGWNELGVRLTIDDTRPCVALLSPANLTFVSPSNRLTITATDANFREIVWILWGETRTSTHSDLSVVLLGSPGDGPFTIDLNASDQAGNYARFSFTFLMDSSSPALSIDGVDSGDAIAPGQVLHVLASDAYLSFVTCSLDGSAPSVMSSADLETGHLAPGWHSICLTAGDYSGKSTTVALNIFVDGQAPAISSALPTSASAGASLTVRANVTDDYGVAVVMLFYELSDGSYASVQMVSTGGAGFEVVLPEGTPFWNGMRVYVLARDSVGNSVETPRVQISVEQSGNPAEGSPPGGGDMISSTWLTSANGLAFSGCLLAFGFLAVLVLQHRKRPSALASTSTTPVPLNPRPSTERSGRDKANPAQEPAGVSEIEPVSRIPRSATSPPEKAAPSSAPKTPRSPPATLLDAIPEYRFKTHEQSDIDYGSLIEQELVLPFRKSSLFREPETIETTPHIEAVDSHEEIVEMLEVLQLIANRK